MTARGFSRRASPPGDMKAPANRYEDRCSSLARWLRNSLTNRVLREGVGETRFPHFPTALGSGWHPHRQGDGETRFPRMFTSVVHAAAPHNDKMNMGFSWEGAALPNPPAGGLFPGRAAPSQTLPRAGCFLGGFHPPKPSRGRAMFTSDGYARGAHRRYENICS